MVNKKKNDMYLLHYLLAGIFVLCGFVKYFIPKRVLWGVSEVTPEARIIGVLFWILATIWILIGNISKSK